MASTLAARSPRACKRRSFLIGLVQMILMAANIKNIAHGHLVFLTGMTIINTWVWVYLVRTVVHSTKGEVWCYAVGSALGADIGVLVGHYLIRSLAVTHFAQAVITQ